VTCAPADHEAAKQRALFAAIAGSAMPERWPRIVLDDNVRAAAADHARAMSLEPGRYVFGCPAGTVTIPLKAWPVQQFVDVAGRVATRHGLPMLLSGVASEAHLLREIAEAGARTGVRMAVWIGETGSLGTLLGLIAHSRLYLGNDTGPMHCAAALDVPVVARFGGGHWPRFLPLARRSFTATQHLPCFGCGWQCWLDTPACMTTIEAETFVGGVDWVLASDEKENRIDVGGPVDSRAERTLVAAAEVTARLRAALEAARAPASVPPVATGRRPKVFVVTPSFNQGRYLRATIDSVLAQDYPNLDYFVSDGGSTDQSVDILRSYGDRLRWKSGPDDGQAAAVAEAWASSDADILAWLNSDDTYLDGAITAAVDHLLAHPEAAMVYGQAWYTNAAGRRVGPYPTKAFDRDLLRGECFICQPAVFVRREVFEVVDLPDTTLRYCLDYDLWIRISRHFQVAYLEQFLATSRLHMENKTLGETDGAIREAILVSRRHFGSPHPNWTLMLAHHRLRHVARRLRMPNRRLQQWLSGYLAQREADRIEAPPYEDGWAGPRTAIDVSAAEDDVVCVDIDFPMWPYTGLLAITATCAGRVLAVRHVRGPRRLTLTFRLPPGGPRPAHVVLEASRSFIPSEHLDGASDMRILSFRILGVRVGTMDSRQDLQVSERIARVADRLRFVPPRVQRRLCRAIARLLQPAAEAIPYEDGWVGPRTELAVSPGPDGRVTLGCDCTTWPFNEPLKITASHEGRVLDVKVVRQGHFDLTFVLPRPATRRATVLLRANRSFIPREHGLSPDQRHLSFRILDRDSVDARSKDREPPNRGVRATTIP
jgi:glycosyltransferase involved in cell wall biosynthesis